MGATIREPAAGATAGPTRSFILGTAGHIDHGKTSLVRALTGTDPDRLPEEKRRGMTIELGFAELTVGDVRFGIVDVPGHERFVKTMVAGATGIDVALLVIAADDSVMPQTVEHVQILRLLGVRRCVVALTKCDLVDPDMVELVTDDVRGLLAETPFSEAEIYPVSSVSGVGLAELQAAILRATIDLPEKQTQLPFRMAVDRVFTVAGRGTVVTGSVLRGHVRSGDLLEILPGGVTAKVRDLQSHGASQDQLRRGQRAAMNLSGIDRRQIERGAELATPGYLQPAHVVDVQIECLRGPHGEMKSAQTARLEIGTAEIPVRLVLLGKSALHAGEQAFAQLRAGRPIPATYGQRFILREETAAHTLGGGRVLRPVGIRRRRAALDAMESLERLAIGEPAERVQIVLRDAGFTRPTELQICARAGVELTELPAILDRLRTSRQWVPVAGTETEAAAAAIDDLGTRLVQWLERHHRLHPELPGRSADAVLGWIARITRNQGLARGLMEQWIETGRIKRLGRFVCAPAFAPALSAADEKFLSQMVSDIRAGAFQPPALNELSFAANAERKRLERLATLAVALGDLIAIDATIYLHAERESELKRIVSELVAAKGGVSVSEVREAIGTSRKYAVPFLEYLDRIGFTRRIGDQRVLA